MFADVGIRLITLLALCANSEALCELPTFGAWANLRIGNDKVPIAVYKHKDIVSNSLLHSGAWETKMSRFLTAGEKMMMDIGANIGVHTVWAAYHGKHVLAVEPMIKNRMLLNATLCRSPKLAKNIQVVPIALGQHTAVCKLYSHPRNTGDCHTICNNHLEEQFKRKKYIFRQLIQVKRLKDIVNFGDLDSMKIDVEGHECAVLATLEQFPRHTVAEITNKNSLDCMLKMANDQQCVHKRTSTDIFVSC